MFYICLFHILFPIRNLPLDDPNNIPDPYVKLHLLPDKAKEHKRKTKVLNFVLLIPGQFNLKQHL
jgi:hypothetical protein